MNQIKFSHKYPKLWNQKQAELISVRLLDAERINDDLRAYDTFYDGNSVDDWGNYEIPNKGLLLQLLFYGDKQIPFCTIRRYTTEKEKYYQSKIGQIFEIVLTSTADNSDFKTAEPKLKRS